MTRVTPRLESSVHRDRPRVPHCAQGRGGQRRDLPEFAVGEDACRRVGQLPVDAKLKLQQFDDAKAFFTTLIEPATQALRTLEQAQAANLDLQRQFTEAATQCAELHARLHDLKAQHTQTASENDRLTGELELARTQARETQEAHAAFTSEVQPKMDAIAEIEAKQRA